MTLVNSISMLSLHTNFGLPQFALGECISLYVSLSFWSSRKDLVILLKCLFYTDVPLEEASDRPVSGGLLHGLGEGTEAGGCRPTTGGWRYHFSFPLAGGTPAFGELIHLQFPFGPL